MDKPIQEERWSGLLKPLLMLVVLGCLPVPGISGHSIAADFLSRQGGANPAVSRGYAQRSPDSIRHFEPNPAGNAFKESATRLFETVLRLIDTQYAEPISKKDVLDHALKRLALTVLPQCMEGVRRMEDSTEPAEQYFYNAVEAIADNCGMDKNRLLNSSMKMLL
ncbi:MAG: hypothetical protein V1792_12640, partial [Pseudomonadota bacterium]